MPDNTIKFPVSTPEVAKMFGFNGNENSEQPEAFFPVASDLPVAGLPLADTSRKIQDLKEHVGTKPIDEKIAELRERQETNMNLNAQTGLPESMDTAFASDKNRVLKKVLKTALPYIIVFAIGVAAYYFFFSNSNFNIAGIFRSVPKIETPKESKLAGLIKQNLESYNQWVAQYFYNVSDPNVLDPNTDNSGNGLSNFHKYLLNLNPKAYDSSNLGMADSQAIAQGINPLTGRNLTDAQKQLVDEYFDMEVISNRLALSNLNKPVNTAAVPPSNSIRGDYSSFNRQAVAGQNTYAPAQTGANLVKNSEIDIDTNTPGRLEIPSLKINVPIIWSKDTKDFENDLKLGVVHYPGTALPGQIGTTYISGHSSNYTWSGGSYNRVFAKLGDIADNTSFRVTVVQKNGKDAILHYVVTQKKEFSPTDQEQFKNTGKSLVALSTCWPINTTAKRLVVFGELTQVER